MRRGAIVAAMAIAGAAGLWLTMGGDDAPRTSAPDPIAEARASGKPVLVEFGANTCAACREMKTVLAQLDASHGERMVIVTIEFGSAQGRRILRDYKVQAIPTQMFFAADGVDLGRHLGAIAAEDILNRLGLADG